LELGEKNTSGWFDGNEKGNRSPDRPRHPMDDAATEPALVSEEEAFNSISSLEKDPAVCSGMGPLRRSNAFKDESDVSTECL